MTEKQRVFLAEQLIPLEALVLQIQAKPYKEMTPDFQLAIVSAVGALRGFILHCEVEEDKGQ